MSNLRGCAPMQFHFIISSYYAPINSKLQHPAPYGQNGVQMPYLIIGFVCQMPLDLKNNRCRLLSSLTKLVYMFRDALYDAAVFTRLELL